MKCHAGTGWPRPLPHTGDEDVDLRRGRPLYLDAARYTQLGRLWGGAALEFDSQLLQNSRVDLPGLG